MLQTRLTEQYGLDVPFISHGPNLVEQRPVRPDYYLNP